MKIKITERALLARLRRRLEKDGEFLKACKENSPSFSDLGHFYLVNSQNCIIAAWINLVTLAEELNVLKEYEELE